MIEFPATETAEAAPELWPDDTFGPLVGPSRAMRELFARLQRMARSEASVLIEGETGTGKELVARVLHDRGPRARRPFVTIDCGSLPPSLLEAELFGHARGAFTDARTARPGAIESADGGTVFLDEIGELPLGMQPRLLRLLEGRTVKRLGENHHRPIDVRFVFATHRSLEHLVRSQAFREDLYFRLAVLRVRVPPLRERGQDIPALAHRLIPAGAAHLLTPALLAELCTRPWSGNVRELRNELERLAVLGPMSIPAGLEPRDEEPLQCEPGTERPDGLPETWASLPYRTFRQRALHSLERAYLSQLLARHGRRISAAALEAQIDRTHLHRLIRRHGM
jgi:DNA-binding NtrC family response regulator